jgi:hypothetical protein
MGAVICTRYPHKRSDHSGPLPSVQLHRPVFSKSQYTAETMQSCPTWGVEWTCTPLRV